MFVSNVEVYDIDKNQWKAINFISDHSKLSIIHPGTV